MFGALSHRNVAQLEPVETAPVEEHLPAINNDVEAKVETTTELESQQRKNKKSLQLKNLIITKFRNKYDCSASNEDEVNNLIQTEVDELFDRE